MAKPELEADFQEVWGIVAIGAEAIFRAGGLTVADVEKFCRLAFVAGWSGGNLETAVDVFALVGGTPAPLAAEDAIGRALAEQTPGGAR